MSVLVRCTLYSTLVYYSIVVAWGGRYTSSRLQTTLTHVVVDRRLKKGLKDFATGDVLVNWQKTTATCIQYTVVI